LNGGLAIGGGMVANDDAVFLQLTAAISAQNEAATKLNAFDAMKFTVSS
jgi:hypothetical protein